RRRQVLCLGRLELEVALKTENLLQRRELWFDVDQRLILSNALRGLPHGGDCRAQQMVCPNHHVDMALAEVDGRRGVVLRRHEENRRSSSPFGQEREDLGRYRLPAVNQDRVSAGLTVRFRTP